MPGVKLATAYYELIPSMAGNQAAISAQMGAAGAQSGKAFSSKFSSGTVKSLAAIGAAGAAAAAVGFVKNSVAEAREAQKVGALTAQVIKTTGGAANVSAAQVSNLAGAISAKTGVDDEAIQSGANMLLTFTNIRNEAGKGNDIFNQATMTAQNMAATFGGDATSNSVRLGKALNDPVKGVSALTKVGATFDAGQKKQIETMVKAGNIAGAQKVILAELSKETGGAAAAQATAGDKLSVAWGNFQETVGTKLLPIIDKFQLALTKVFTFIAAHQSVMVALGAIVGVILVAALVAAAAAAWTFTTALLANPIVWIIVGLIALIAAIVLVVKHWDLIKKKTAEVWDAIKAKLAAAWDAIKAKAAAAWQAIQDWISKVWDRIKTTVVTKGAAVLAWFKALPGKLLSLLGRAGTWLLHVGEDIVRGIITGIGNGFKWLKAKIVELGGNLLTWAKEILHIGSPSKVFADEVGKWIPAGIALGIDQNSSTVQTSLSRLTAELALAELSTSSRLTAPPTIASVASDRPIRMADGTLLGWVRDIASDEAELVLNKQILAVPA